MALRKYRILIRGTSFFLGVFLAKDFALAALGCVDTAFAGAAASAFGACAFGALAFGASVLAFAALDFAAGLSA